MRSFSIIAIALVALVASSSAAPLLNQPADTTELQARIDIYNDFLAGLFSGLVQTTFGSVSNFLNQLITENPLGVGKRDLEQPRIEALTFIYENILQDLFEGLVTNAFGHLSSTLTNLIQTNPLGLGKRETQDDLVARVDALSFLYDNILADLFSGLVGNTLNHLSNTLLNLIQTNPLGVGKRSIDLQQIQTLLAPLASNLVQKLQNLAQQGVAALADPTKLAQLLLAVVIEIKSTFTTLSQQLSPIVPQTMLNEVSHVLAAAQSALIYWASGLAGSLGPVIGPFRP